MGMRARHAPWDTAVYDDEGEQAMNAPFRDKVNLRAKLALFTDQWSPKIVGELNGQHVKIAKVEGEFVWHAHDDEDELFLVIHGRLTLRLRDRDVVLEPGELFIVPAGVEHLPIAEEETHILMFEPISTVNTGTAGGPRTVASPDTI
jgi:mannose-6-phosphate isomerase-like protein (cupin superfamily)